LVVEGKGKSLEMLVEGEVAAVCPLNEWERYADGPTLMLWDQKNKTFIRLL